MTIEEAKQVVLKTIGCEESHCPEGECFNCAYYCGFDDRLTALKIALKCIYIVELEREIKNDH